MKLFSQTKRNPLLIITFALTLFLSIAGFAAGDEHHGDIKVPIEVYYQLFNLLIVVGGITYFTRAKVVQFFKDRSQQYRHHAEKTLRAKQEAEKTFLDIKHRIEKLEQSKAENLQRAMSEAADMKAQMMREAEEASARVRKDVDTAIQQETEKAKRNLKNEILKEGLAEASTMLAKDTSSSDQGKLQAQFLQHLQAL